MQSTQLDEPLVLETLRQVVDPEIDCNIVDLGLIYGTRIEGRKVTVKMTLTTPGCPMHESIAWGVKNALRNLDAVEEAEVEIVWDPPWNPSMMTNYGRARIGLRTEVPVDLSP
jgi:metal-sulfur cluster biosynthetic enzyme